MPVEFLTGICFYNGDEPKSGLVQDFVTAYNPGMCHLALLVIALRKTGKGL